MVPIKKEDGVFLMRRVQGFFSLLVFFFLLAFSNLGFSLNEAVLGDRVVITVNNVPFTQRQIEGYINIKESLRKNASGSIRLVDASSWSDALFVFTNDAIMLLEAQRIGGVSIPESLAQKYLQMLKEKSATYPELKAMFVRLGLNDGGLERAIDAVLRVAAFRKSRERQETQSQLQLKSGGFQDANTGMSNWQRELIDRAIVRKYEDADRYVLIRPTLGG